MVELLRSTARYDPVDAAEAGVCHDAVNEASNAEAAATASLHSYTLDRFRKAMIALGVAFVVLSVGAVAISPTTSMRKSPSPTGVADSSERTPEFLVAPKGAAPWMPRTYARVDGTEQKYVHADGPAVVAGSFAANEQAPVIQPPSPSAVLSDTALAQVALFSYNQTVSMMMASLTRVAFCSYCVEKWTCEAPKQWNIQVVPGTPRQITSAYLGDPHAVHLVIAKLVGPAPLAGMCLVSFSGSRGKVDSFLDADFPLWDVPIDWRCPGCKAASGWGQAWAPADALVAGNLTEIGCGSSKLAFTGHSMGSALATLAAWTLKVKHNFAPGLFYNFESPRVLDDTFAQRWETDLGRGIPAFRITRHLDPVVHLPPTWLGYAHAPAAEAYYGQSGSNRAHAVCPSLEQCGVLDSDSCACSGRDANLAKDLYHTANHCGDPWGEASSSYPLVSNGNICSCM
jgi:hypothetical protein